MAVTMLDYKINIDSSLLGLRDFLASKNYSRIVVLVDENTNKHCLPIFEETLGQSFLTYIVPSGETQKSIDTCQMIWTWLLDNQCDRHSLLISIGGGVLGDIGGFCGSTYKRGIDFVQIPTTLLAQVDASVGGKTGINFGGIKNSVGTFSTPAYVHIDTNFLKTLPYRELRSGFAEVIKHALIADADYFFDLKKIEHLKRFDAWENIIKQSIKIKSNIVAQDFRENGLRKSLNFGHTIGHAVESYFLESATPLLHGEAVAIGMIVETYISSQVGLLASDTAQDIIKFLKNTYHNILLPLEDTSVLLELMKHDKKNQQANINFTLLKAIGDCVINQQVKSSCILEAIKNYNKN